MSLDQYKKMHTDGYFPGHSTKKWSEDIKEMLKKHRAVTVLDYGSGKGMQYTQQKLHHEWGVEQPHLYEPAVPGMDVLPDQNFDAVLCVDVLEHLDGKDLADCVENVIRRAEKCAFFAITCRPAKKTLPDGRNCHISIHPPIWWHGYIEGVNNRVSDGYTDIILKFEE